MSAINDLLLLLKESKSPNIKKISNLILKISKDDSELKIAAEHSEQKIMVDIHELESILNPDNFEFPEPDIGRISIDL